MTLCQIRKRLEFMNKPQFLILLVLSLFFSVMVVTRVLLLRDLEMNRAVLIQSQTIMAKGQSSEKVLSQIINRVAQASEREPDLRDLLKQYHIHIKDRTLPLTAPAAKGGY